MNQNQKTMELRQVNTQRRLIVPESDVIKPKTSNFIEANTQEVTLSHLKNDCIIPVFAKDNETTISHHEFITATNQVVMEHFGSEMLFPEIRVSHPIKGRIPSAIGKPVKELLEHEKTRYYERVMFVLKHPGWRRIINGNELDLCVVGVRAYNQENLYSRKSIEKFKIAIGFQVKVCLNLCVWTDGTSFELRVSSMAELQQKIIELISIYDAELHLEQLKALSQYHLTEKQFAQFLGKLRMYGYQSQGERKQMTSVLLNDTQVSQIARNYYQDKNFNRQDGGDISLWNIYNLCTGATKSSYIDSFVERNANALKICNDLKQSLDGSKPSWLLN